MTSTTFATIPEALDELRAGRPIVVIDDESRENEGDVVVAAEFATPEAINFMAREARGLICVAMTGSDLDRLGLKLMVPQTSNVSRFGSPFTISVDAAEGVTTGISTYDRAHTIATLINPDAGPSDLSAPGHIFPLRAHDGGVDARRGHTEAGVDLMRLASLYPAAVICEVLSEDGTMSRGAELAAFAARHDLIVVTIEELSKFEVERTTGPIVTQLVSAQLPTKSGTFIVTAFRDKEGLEHLALQMGSIKNAPIVRIHSECLTGDVLGSLRCDCGDQLSKALETIAREGSGVVIYLRQEGRGIGLANKIRAYALQDAGLDTVEANHNLGFSADLREYVIAAAILRKLGVEQVRLMTNNPRKVSDLEAHGVAVTERISIETERRPENARYLDTKAAKLKHVLSGTRQNPEAE